jgi:NTE family protein
VVFEWLGSCDPGDRTAFVLGGGGILGAAEVGMLRSLLERGLVPDLVIGSSVGALNGAFIAAEPTLAGVEALAQVWTSISNRGVLTGSMLGRLSTLARRRTYLHSSDGLRRLLEDRLGPRQFEDLAVRFECIAACIERASAQWFTSGPLTRAVLASCAVPGLLPAVEIDGEHFFDGGLVSSVPVGRAVKLGARRVFVLHVGRIERALTAPSTPWQVGLVAFEIARRHQFEEDMSAIPEGIEVHVLPTGTDVPPMSVRYRSAAGIPGRIETAHRAASTYLDRHELG